MSLHNIEYRAFNDFFDVIKELIEVTHIDILFSFMVSDIMSRKFFQINKMVKQSKFVNKFRLHVQ